MGRGDDSVFYLLWNVWSVCALTKIFHASYHHQKISFTDDNAGKVWKGLQAFSAWQLGMIPFTDFYCRSLKTTLIIAMSVTCLTRFHNKKETEAALGVWRICLPDFPGWEQFMFCGYLLYNTIRLKRKNFFRTLKSSLETDKRQEEVSMIFQQLFWVICITRPFYYLLQYSLWFWHMVFPCFIKKFLGMAIFLMVSG